MTPEQEQKLNTLLEWKKSLESYQSIPLQIDQSFRARFAIPILSTKSITSENQAVNEAGVATYSVLKTPDAFLKVTVGTTTYNIPVYT